MSKGEVIDVVSGDYLKSVIESEGFIKRVIKAGDLAEETGYETSFKVFKKIGDARPLFYRIEIGCEDCVSYAERYRNSIKERFKKKYGKEFNMGILRNLSSEESKSLEKIMSEVDRANTYRFSDDYEIYEIMVSDIYKIIDLHFHPDFMEPSGRTGDLYASNLDITGERKNGLNLRPINVICRNDKDGSIDILLYQQIPDQIEDWSFVGELHRTIWNEMLTHVELDIVLKAAASGESVTLPSNPNEAIDYASYMPGGNFCVADEMRKTGLYKAEGILISRDAKRCDSANNIRNMGFTVRRSEKVN